MWDLRSKGLGGSAPTPNWQGRVECTVLEPLLCAKREARLIYISVGPQGVCVCVCVCVCVKVPHGTSYKYRFLSLTPDLLN